MALQDKYINPFSDYGVRKLFETAKIHINLIESSEENKLTYYPMLKQIRFPVYTTVSADPTTFCKAVGREVFDYPFFNEGVDRSKKPELEHRHFPLEAVGDHQGAELLEIRGLIFHTSHCGSTLLARMLNQCEQIRVVSETEAINGLLLAHALHHLPAAQTVAHLRQIMEAYRVPIKQEKYLIFKLTSWNVFFIGLFLELYPEVEWIYIDRNDEDTIHSLLQNNYGFAQWWDHPVDVLRRYFTGPENTYTTRYGYLKGMIEGHRYHAEQNRNHKSYFVRYPDFIDQFDQILSHFRLNFTEAEKQNAKRMIELESKSVEEVPFRSRI